ncbi:hypothetical protein O0I10_006711 [Lichtheimia ornata]|uniref:F-box domain-containing protein n=1 Tax=Lichtheimia ornata TaxID=688661 RepID=A0AAD7V3Q6_9FUNG|nr:uncharacterized protein O0I10_006711 [Lichtheimia ornata]KAJ8657645.1 hypothetical protein O0I10_006711 [Lichtheimia ornata]
MQCIDDSWSMEDWMQVDAIAPYIKTMIVDESTPFAFWLLGERLRFSSLKDLTLTVARSQVVIPSPQVMITSRPRSNTITPAVPEPLHLHHLLDHCPALVELKIACKETIFIATSSRLSATYPSIRHLELRYASPTGENPRYPFSIKYHVSPALFKHFPRLRLLALRYPQPRYHDMQTIFGYCPMLQQLFLGGIQKHSVPEGTTSLQRGLRLLSLHGPSSQGNLIAQLLRDHSTTIKSLAMECVGAWPSSAQILINDHVLFPRLQSLHLHRRMSRHPMALIRAVIGRAPNLESVNVDNGGLQGVILETLIGKPVQNIDLVCTPWSNPASALNFLDHHAQLGMRSTLQEVTCTITSDYEYRNTMRIMHPMATFKDLGGGWMLSIAALQQLQSLELSFDGDVYDQSLSTFLRLLSQRSPSLENLTLAFYLSFNIEWLLPLSRHPKLKKMVIASKRFPKYMTTLVQHFARLQAFDLKLKSTGRRGLPIDIPLSRLL